MTPPRVLVGRREGAGGELVSLLEAAGFEPVSVPLIEIRPPDDPQPLRDAVTRLASGAFDGVAFTSVPAVDAVLATASRLGTATPIADGTVVAAVGPGTAAALAAAGVRVSLVPSGASAAALADAWPSADTRADAWPSAGARPSAGDRRPGRSRAVLLPRSEIAGRALPDALRAKGYHVVSVVAYRIAERPMPAGTAAELAAGEFAAVVLSSGSGARSLARHAMAPDTAVVAIGDTTAAVAAEVGLPVVAVAAEPSAVGLVLAVRAAVDARTGFAGTRPPSSGAAAAGPDTPLPSTGAVPSGPGRSGPTSQQR